MLINDCAKWGGGGRGRRVEGEEEGGRHQDEKEGGRNGERKKNHAVVQAIWKTLIIVDGFH